MADNDRLEREINEILNKIDQFPNAQSRRAMARKRAIRRFGHAIGDRQRAVVRWLASVSISQVMLVAFLMILGSLFLRRISPLMMQWVFYAGIVLFLSSFAILVFTRGGSGSAQPPQYWRGREIQTRRDPMGQRLRRWWASRKRPRR